MADTFSIQNINATIGAFEIGVLICMFLLGVLTVQAYVYYSRFPRDHWKIKALVSLIYCIVFAVPLCLTLDFRLL